MQKLHELRLFTPYSPNITKDDCAMLLDVRKPPTYRDVAVALSQELKRDAVKRDTNAEISEDEIERLRNSGLLPLVVPKQYGGLGATWGEALKIVCELSQADGSIGQLYGNHLNLTVLNHLSGTPEQTEKYYRYTARNHWLWANAIDTWDTRLTITPEGDRFRLNGVKCFDSIVEAADLRVFSAWQEGMCEPFFCLIPKDRLGVISNSSSFIFNNVLLEKDEILQPPNSCERAIASFLGIIAQLTKTYVSLGIGQGALDAIQEHRTIIRHPKFASTIDSAAQVSHSLNDCGDLRIELTTAIRLADRVAALVQTAWEKKLRLTYEERQDVANAVFSAEVFATRVGLTIANHLLELGATNCDLNRYWRNLRTFGGVSMPWHGVPQTWMLNNFPQPCTPC
jgi:alkylation response protein AidB-like acyl-CoA dehydrogenase